MTRINVPFPAQSETDKEETARARRSVAVVTLFVAAVFFIHQNQQIGIGKDLLGVPLRDPVLVEALATIAVVPVEPFDRAEIEHPCILPSYTMNAITRPSAGTPRRPPLPPPSRR